MLFLFLSFYLIEAEIANVNNSTLSEPEEPESNGNALIGPIIVGIVFCFIIIGFSIFCYCVHHSDEGSERKDYSHSGSIKIPKNFDGAYPQVEGEGEETRTEEEKEIDKSTIEMTKLNVRNPQRYSGSWSLRPQTATRVRINSRANEYFPPPQLLTQISASFDSADLISNSADGGSPSPTLSPEKRALHTIPDFSTMNRICVQTYLMDSPRNEAQAGPSVTKETEIPKLDITPFFGTP